MKRAVGLILTLLLINLAHDGCLGKAEVIPPDFFQNISLSSSQQSDSGKVDFHYKPSLANHRGMSGWWQFQPVTFQVQSTLKIITYCHTNSSGGIPL